jgi:DNA-binding response OmpR family regulator
MSEDEPGGRTRVLIVEDDVMIRMLIEDMLAELGFTVTAQAAKLSDAMVAAHDADIDLAILDINLNGESTGPVAATLAQRGKPFMFATGYGEHVLPPEFRDRPLLKKPFPIDSLRRTIDATLARGG